MFIISCSPKPKSNPQVSPFKIDELATGIAPSDAEQNSVIEKIIKVENDLSNLKHKAKNLPQGRNLSFSGRLAN